MGCYEGMKFSYPQTKHGTESGRAVPKYYTISMEGHQLRRFSLTNMTSSSTWRNYSPAP